MLTAYGPQLTLFLDYAEGLNEDAAISPLVDDRTLTSLWNLRPMAGRSFQQQQPTFYDDAFVAQPNTTEHAVSKHASTAHHPAFLTLIILNVWTTLSNAIVLYVMLRTPTLRRRFGCVMFSLSFADLCSSLVVMPLAIYYFSNSGGWNIGSYMCVGWVTADVFFCTASICHHASIAIHRYLAIAKPHQMSMITSNTPILVQLIMPSWAVGFLIAMILAIQALMREDIVFRDNTCGLQDRLYLVYSSVVSFFIPLSLIILVSLKSILLLRHHLKLKQQAILKNMPRPTLPAALPPPNSLYNYKTSIASTASVQAEIIVQITDEDGNDEKHVANATEQNVEEPDFSLNNKERLAPEMQFIMASPLKKPAQNVPKHSPSLLRSDDENLKALAEEITFNTSKGFQGRKSRAMSLTPNIDKQLMSKLRTSRSPFDDRLSKMTSFRNLIESYLELSTYVYAGQPTPGSPIAAKRQGSTQSGGSASPMVLSRTSSINSESTITLFDQEFTETAVMTGFGNKSGLALSTSTTPAMLMRTNTILKRPSQAMMEAIVEEEHLLASTNTLNLVETPTNQGPHFLLKRRASIVSFGSDVALGDEDSLDIELALPTTDFDRKAMISVDELTPSMDLLTSYGFVIPDIPSPVDEEHPLDLRIVFSRTISNFNQLQPADDQQPPRETSSAVPEVRSDSEFANIKKRVGIRKRAYTVSFPVRHVQVQQAPMAKVEVYSSPKAQRKPQHKRNSLQVTSNAEPPPSPRRYSQSAEPPDQHSRTPVLTNSGLLARRQRTMRVHRTSKDCLKGSALDDSFTSPPNVSVSSNSFGGQSSSTALPVLSSHEQLEDDGEECEEVLSLPGLTLPHQNSTPKIVLNDQVEILQTPDNSRPPSPSCLEISTQIDEDEEDETSNMPEPSVTDSEQQQQPRNNERLGKVALLSPSHYLRSPRLIRRAFSFRSVDEEKTSSTTTTERAVNSSFRVNQQTNQAKQDQLLSPQQGEKTLASPLPNKIAPSNSRNKRMSVKRSVSTRQRQREKEKQAERVLLFVLFIFVCLWLPFFTTNFLYGVCPGCVYEEVFVAFTWCGWSASALNPIVFTVFNREFKRAFIRIFCRRCSSQKGAENRFSDRQTVRGSRRSMRHQQQQRPIVSTIKRQDTHRVTSTTEATTTTISRQNQLMMTTLSEALYEEDESHAVI